MNTTIFFTLLGIGIIVVVGMAIRSHRKRIKLIKEIESNCNDIIKTGRRIVAQLENR